MLAVSSIPPSTQAGLLRGLLEYESGKDKAVRAVVAGIGVGNLVSARTGPQFVERLDIERRGGRFLDKNERLRYLKDCPKLG